MEKVKRDFQRKLFTHWSGYRRLSICIVYAFAHFIDGFSILFLGRSPSLVYRVALWSAKKIGAEYAAR